MCDCIVIFSGVFEVYHNTMFWLNHCYLCERAQVVQSIILFKLPLKQTIHESVILVTNSFFFFSQIKNCFQLCSSWEMTSGKFNQKIAEWWLTFKDQWSHTPKWTAQCLKSLLKQSGWGWGSTPEGNKKVSTTSVVRLFILTPPKTNMAVHQRCF